MLSRRSIPPRLRASLRPPALDGRPDCDHVGGQSQRGCDHCGHDRLSSQFGVEGRRRTAEPLPPLVLVAAANKPWHENDNDREFLFTVARWFSLAVLGLVVAGILLSGVWASPAPVASMPPRPGSRSHDWQDEGKCGWSTHGARYRPCRDAWKSSHSPWTPLSACAPRPPNLIPEPATRSLTRRETRISPGRAIALTLAAMWTAIP